MRSMVTVQLDQTALYLQPVYFGGQDHLSALLCLRTLPRRQGALYVCLHRFRNLSSSLLHQQATSALSRQNEVSPSNIVPIPTVMETGLLLNGAACGFTDSTLGSLPKTALKLEYPCTHCFPRLAGLLCNLTQHFSLEQAGRSGQAS